MEKIMEKRKYQNRRKEFLDMTVEQLVEYKDKELSVQIGNLQEKITKGEATDADKLEHKELFHKRQRLYRRLAKLGKPVREKKKEQPISGPVVVEPSPVIAPSTPPVSTLLSSSSETARVVVTSTKYTDGQLNSNTTQAKS